MAYAIVKGSRMHYDIGGTGDPVLLIAGLSMPGAMLTPPDFARALAKLIRRARLSVMAGGHPLMLEHTDAFNRALRRFPKGVRPK